MTLLGCLCLATLGLCLIESYFHSRMETFILTDSSRPDLYAQCSMDTRGMPVHGAPRNPICWDAVITSYECHPTIEESRGAAQARRHLHRHWLIFAQCILTARGSGMCCRYRAVSILELTSNGCRRSRSRWASFRRCGGSTSLRAARCR